MYNYTSQLNEYNQHPPPNSDTIESINKRNEENNIPYETTVYLTNNNIEQNIEDTNIHNIIYYSELSDEEERRRQENNKICYKCVVFSCLSFFILITLANYGYF